jgi:hypothetical protein
MERRGESIVKSWDGVLVLSLCAFCVVAVELNVLCCSSAEMLKEETFGRCEKGFSELW